MNFILRVFYSWMGLLPVASSNRLYYLLSVYSWTLYLLLIALVNYYEILWDIGWIKSGENIVTGCFGTLIDCITYLAVFCHIVRFSQDRAYCLQMVRSVRSKDMKIVAMTVLGAVALGQIAYQYSSSLLENPDLFKPQMYKAWIYVLMSYNCFLAVLIFCGVLNSMAARITSLKKKINVRTATPALLCALDAEKDKCAKFMAIALKMHSKFLLFISLDVFCRSVHYLYITIWGYVEGKHWKPPLIFFLPFVVHSAVKVVMLTHLILTCCNAKKSVADFNRHLYEVVLKKKELVENETLQIIVIRWSCIKFSPGGFYELQRGFLVSTLNAIATYLTVLIQVSNLKSNS